ncbi:hypothetical protein, partial [uncultured Ruminococcus sp.]|uniref:hypothetical protein n=1 Tax=uncultured Ruminococcus sp. TaxID=165186 RepID=UPI00258BF9A1
CGISMQSAEKSDYASYAQALFSVSLIYVFHYFNMFSPKKQVPHPIPYKIFKKHRQHRKTVL